jgi:hypothetical protein
MQNIVPLFIALDIATRTNWLDAEILRNRHGARLKRELQIIAHSRGDKEIEPSKFEATQTLYTGVDLEDQILNDVVLVEMLVSGRYNKESICTSLDSSSYFAKPSELPPWRKVIEFDKFPDDVVEEAVSAMEQQFSKRSVTEIGEMLHIFALRMMMADHGILTRSVEEIGQESKSYVDDLLTEGRLLPGADEEELDFSIRMSGSHNIGFWIEDSYRDIFARVIAHLRAQRNVALERTYPTLANQLLEMLASEPREFAGAISYLPGGTQKFARLPIMKLIPVENFLEAWLNATNQREAWYWTRRGFEQRYENPDFLLGKGPLASEAEWLREVLAKMRSCAEAETGFRRFRIERFIPNVQVPHATA